MMQKNRNRPGYKKTKVGWIPEDWEICRASDVLDVRDGTHDTPKKTDMGVLLITSKNIIHGQIDASNCYCISEKDAFLVNKRSAVAKGDILMSMIGTVGESALVDTPPNFCIKNVGLFKSNESRLYSRHLIKYFHSNSSRRAIHQASNGGIQKFISLTGLRQLPIPLPPLPEQKAIAGVLECWDKVIRNYEKKIEKKRNTKKGLMQRLLSGKQRLPGFSGEWKETTFGETFSFLKTYAFSREQLTISQSAGCNIHNIHYGDLHATYEECMLDCAKEKRIPLLRNGADLPPTTAFLEEGDVVIADASEDYEGVCACVELRNVGSKKITGGLHTFVARDAAGKTAKGYRGYVLKELAVSRELKRIATGVSVHGVSKTNLAKVKLAVSSLQEQQAIATVLSAADSEIKALERKLAVLKDQKRFLLNNLVTGTLRLPQFAATENK